MPKSNKIVRVSPADLLIQYIIAGLAVTALVAGAIAIVNIFPS